MKFTFVYIFSVLILKVEINVKRNLRFSVVFPFTIIILALPLELVLVA